MSQYTICGLPCIVLDDDDVELLDLIARTGGDLSKARPLTGSNVKEPSVEDYSIVGKCLYCELLLHTSIFVSFKK